MAMRIIAIAFGCLISTAALANDARLEECRAKLIKAQELEMLYDLKIARGSAQVYVGPTYFQVAYDAKQGFANTVNCFLLAGEEGKYMNFDLLHWQTGKRVAQYKYGKVVAE